MCIVLLDDSWRPMTSSSDEKNEYNLEDIHSGAEFVKKALRFLRDNSQDLLPYLKLFITFFQVLSSFISFQVVWPTFLLNIMSWLKGTLFLDVIALPGLSCLWRGVSFQSRLMTYTLGPLAVIFFLLVPVPACIMLARFVPRSYGQRLDRVVSAAWKNNMFWVFLIYPVVSLSTMEAFNCQPEGLRKLAADFNEPWPGQTHLLRIWSYVFIAVYPLGIPLFCYLSMLAMGVHLVARDVKFSLLLKSLVMKYASLSPSNASEEINLLLADCEQDIKITKPTAINILVKFETLELEARTLKTLQESKRKTKQENKESKKSGMCTLSCISGQSKSKPEKDVEAKNIRKRVQKAHDDNPRILSALLLQLAKRLLRENTISIPRISWKDFRDSEASRKLIQAERKTVNSESDLFSGHPSSLESDHVDLKSQYAIHPDLDDPHDWGWWINLQSSVGNLFMTIPEAWKMFNKRKQLGGKALERIGFLFAAYKVEYWYWEMFEMLRKFMMTTVLVVFLYPGQPAQLGAGFLISLLFMVAQMNLSPYCTEALNTTQSSALLANTLTLFVGLMLIIDFNMEAEAKLAGDESYNNNIGRSVVSVIVVIVNIAVLAIPTSVAVLQFDIKTKILKICSSKKRGGEETEDQKSDHSDSEPPPVVDTLSEPLHLSGQSLFPLPIRLGLSREEPEHVSTESAKTTNLTTPPVLNFERNEEVTSCYESSIASDAFKPFNTNANLVFKILHGEQQVKTNFDHRIYIDQGQLSTSFITSPSFLEAEADTVCSQMLVSELHSQAHADSRQWPGDISGQFDTSTSLPPEVLLQQATSEAIALVAEGLAEAKGLPESRGNYF